MGEWTCGPELLGGWTWGADDRRAIALTIRWSRAWEIGDALTHGGADTDGDVDRAYCCPPESVT